MTSDVEPSHVPQAPRQDQAPRPELIKTAVRFLENSKVKGTTPDLKTSFLKKKGLTDEEITQAFQQVQSQPFPTQQLAVNPTGQPAIYLPQTSVGAKIRDFLNVLLLIGGFSYSIKLLWKKYIRRWLFGEEESPSPSHLLYTTSQQLIAAVAALQQGVNKLQESLDGLKGTGEMTEVKKEILSVKGLLLSSRSFPQQPSLPAPAIPAWQLPDSPRPAAAVTVAPVRWEGSGGSSSSEIEIINHENSSDEGTELLNPPAVVQDNLVSNDVETTDQQEEDNDDQQSNELD